jgi:hypothetical protein
MTENEALEILKKHNIHQGLFDTERLFLRAGDEILGEHIGEIANGYIYIADYIPSVIGKTYLSVSDTAVLLSNPDAPAVLNRMLDRLKDSAERYEEEIRRKRVSDIHQYFLKRNMKIKILPPDVEIPDPPDDGTLYFR